VTIVDCAVYEDGHRRAGPVPLDHALEEAGRENAFVWIGLVEPAEDEFDSVAREFELHELAVEDAIKAHQRPKLEVYGDTLFLVLKTARYHEEEEDIEFGELLLFVGADFVVSVRHGRAAELAGVRATLEQNPEQLRHGPTAVLHAIVDLVVDGYMPVVAAIEDDVEEVEEDVFAPGRTSPAERIYNLKREVLELSRATRPLVGPLDRLARGEQRQVPEEMRSYFRDVYDHLLRTNEQVENLRDLLTSTLDANLTQVGVRQNEDMRKISAWVAIVAVPTLVAGIYGMNFEHMPELKWELGYPLALAVMLLVCVTLYRLFKRSGWL
jgi:magnesium transporter